MRICVLSLMGIATVSIGVAAQTPRPAPPPQTVTLPLAEYDRLLDLAARFDTTPPDPPALSIVATADLRVRVDAGMARGVFTVAGEVLIDGVAMVPLLGSTTLIEAIANGGPVPLMTHNGRYHGLIEGPGPFTVALGWGARVTQAAGRASFVLPVPPAGAVRASIDLPGDQADVQVTPGVVASRLVVNGRTIVDVTLDPGEPASVSWSMRDSVQSVPARDLRASADVFTLVTVGDSDVRMAALVDVTVLQGELRTLAVKLPSGFELMSVSGSSIATSAPANDGVVLTFADPAARSHQFLANLERPHPGSSFAVEAGVLTMPAVQRERGEMAVEGVGTLELTADARDGLHRMDAREVSASLQALASQPLLAAFRYQRAGAVAPTVALDVRRFPDAGVLAAVAERAEATTLVTAEGRALTEIKLQVQNRAQPFLKVVLPPGASMVAVEVAGQSAKPVQGPDGTRVPLLRSGLRPSGSYEVSFVYLHAAAPLARKGDLAMALPRLDMPIGIVNWEVFVPERYSATAVDGNAIDLRWVARSTARSPLHAQKVASPGADGVTRRAPGVSEAIGAVAESITVAGQTPQLDADLKAKQPSQNVVDLQRRTSGVLPIRVDVPRAGTSHRFVKPLVIDQETTVTLRYQRR